LPVRRSLSPKQVRRVRRPAVRIHWARPMSLLAESLVPLHAV
jgi:hypothetical protein